jgi:glutathione S-transferase
MYPMVEMIDYPERFANSSDGAAAIRERADAILHRRWQVLEANVTGSPYFVASGFSATDLYITKFSVWLDAAWRREHLPKVEALTAAVLARPALAPVWARHVR